MVAKKYTEIRYRPRTLQAMFTLAEDMSAKMLEAKSFEHTSTYRLPSSVNELCNSNKVEINKISHGRYNKSSYGKSGGYKETTRTRIKNHGKTRIKSHGIRIVMTVSHGKTRAKSHGITKNQSPRIHVSPSLKMLNSFVLQVTMRAYLLLFVSFCR